MMRSVFGRNAIGGNGDWALQHLHVQGFFITIHWTTNVYSCRQDRENVLLGNLRQLVQWLKVTQSR